MQGQRNNIKSLLPLLCIAVMASSCSNHSLTVSEYLKWVETGKKIETTKKVEDYEFKAKYLPREFLAYRDLRNEKPDAQKMRQSIGNYTSSYCMVLKIATANHDKDVLGNDAQGKEGYYGRLQYFISGIQNDLTLCDGIDTLHCTICNFERTYNVSPYLTFYLVFDTKKPQKEHFEHDLTLAYDDRTLGVGKVNLSLDRSDLNSLPKIQMP
jgi:hypothetical protein